MQSRPFGQRAPAGLQASGRWRIPGGLGAGVPRLPMLVSVRFLTRGLTSLAGWPKYPIGRRFFSSGEAGDRYGQLCQQRSEGRRPQGCGRAGPARGRPVRTEPCAGDAAAQGREPALRDAGHQPERLPAAHLAPVYLGGVGIGEGDAVDPRHDAEHLGSHAVDQPGTAVGDSVHSSHGADQERARRTADVPAGPNGGGGGEAGGGGGGAALRQPDHCAGAAPGRGAETGAGSRRDR